MPSWSENWVPNHTKLWPKRAIRSGMRFMILVDLDQSGDTFARQINAHRPGSPERVSFQLIKEQLTEIIGPHDVDWFILQPDAWKIAEATVFTKADDWMVQEALIHGASNSLVLQRITLLEERTQWGDDV